MEPFAPAIRLLPDDQGSGETWPSSIDGVFGGRSLGRSAPAFLSRLTIARTAQPSFVVWVLGAGTMPHFASAGFWAAYNGLSPQIRKLADHCHELLETNPQHPSLHLKRVGRFWSVRVGNSYRALGVDAPDGILWIWIGPHSDYNRIIRS